MFSSFANAVNGASAVNAITTANTNYNAFFINTPSFYSLIISQYFGIVNKKPFVMNGFLNLRLY